MNKGVLEKLRIKSSSHTWSWTFQIHCFDGVSDSRCLVGQIAEILSCNFALASYFTGFFALRAELFDGALEADAEVVGRDLEDFAD
jgi:hypothetical protein